MINGDPKEFLAHVCSGQDTPYQFKGEKCWCQGFTVGTGFHIEIFRCSPPYDDVWQCTRQSPEECVKEFMAAPVFSGKSFWEVEKEVEWLDE